MQTTEKFLFTWMFLSVSINLFCGASVGLGSLGKIRHKVYLTLSSAGQTV